MEWPEDPDGEFYGDPCDADTYEGPAEWYAKDMKRRRTIIAIVLGILFFIVVML